MSLRHAGAKRTAAEAELGDGSGHGGKYARFSEHGDAVAVSAVRFAAASNVHDELEDSEEARKAELRRQLESFEKDKAGLLNGPSIMLPYTQVMVFWHPAFHAAGE